MKSSKIKRKKPSRIKRPATIEKKTRESQRQVYKKRTESNPNHVGGSE